jgi:hypothetical protein
MTSNSFLARESHRVLRHRSECRFQLWRRPNLEPNFQLEQPRRVSLEVVHATTQNHAVVFNRQFRPWWHESTPDRFWGRLGPDLPNWMNRRRSFERSRQSCYSSTLRTRTSARLIRLSSFSPSCPPKSFAQRRCAVSICSRVAAPVWVRRRSLARL